MTVAADEAWYLAQSSKRSHPPHCPLAANDKCPRYFESQKHVAAAGADALRISDEILSLLDEKWAASDVVTSFNSAVQTWNVVGGGLFGVDGFCPEVTARIFGHYCSSIRAFPDEDARESRCKILEREKVSKTDPRWEWMGYEPKHYAFCHEYSVYQPASQLRQAKARERSEKISPRQRFQVFSRDEYRCVYCGATGKEAPLHVDHKISLADGGTSEFDNLVTACERCNLGKGAKSV